jgi:hypothetical protein
MFLRERERGPDRAPPLRQELQKDGSHGQQELSKAKGSVANLVGRAAHKGAISQKSSM